MKSKNTQIFLGKAGKIYGPFERIEKIENIENYTWIWDTENGIWKTLESPPPSPLSGTQIESAALQVVFAIPQKSRQATPTPLSRNTQKAPPLNFDSIDAICFDHFNLIHGKISAASDRGCNLISNHKRGEKLFSLRRPVKLSLFDTESLKTQIIEASLSQAHYQNHTWVYALQWNEAPLF